MRYLRPLSLALSLLASSCARAPVADARPDSATQQGQKIVAKEAATIAAQNGGPPKSAEDRIADYTRGLTWFTGGLFAATLLLWWVTRDTLKQVKREFHATQRPKLIVRSVAMK